MWSTLHVACMSLDGVNCIGSEPTTASPGVAVEVIVIPIVLVIVLVVIIGKSHVSTGGHHR